MTKVTFHSACPEHDPYLLVLGWEAPATGLQPPIIIPHMLPDLPVLLSLLLTACWGRAVTEERSTASPSWWLKSGAEGEGSMASVGQGKHGKPNPAVKIDVGNQTEMLCWEADTGISDLLPEQCCKPCHFHHLFMMFQEPFRNRRASLKPI